MKGVLWTPHMTINSLWLNFYLFLDSYDNGSLNFCTNFPILCLSSKYPTLFFISDFQRNYKQFSLKLLQQSFQLFWYVAPMKLAFNFAVIKDSPFW